MATTKKITIADQFAEVEKFLRENGKVAMADFISERAELHTKRNGSKSSKPTKKQSANEKLKELILEQMEIDTPYTVTELCNKVEVDQELLNELGVQTLTNSKVTSMLTQLVNIAKVSRTESKGKAYYSKLFQSKKVKGNVIFPLTNP